MKSTIVANWKMNPATRREARKLFDATRKAAEAAPNVSVVVAPPALFLRELKRSYKGKKIAFAAQNARAEASGAFTGEISFAQCKDAGVSYGIVGHAERRGMGETNEDTGKKVAAALGVGITPILCVGEARRSGSGEYFSFVREQLRAGFADVAPAKVPNVIVAYEPVWAIGAERAMSPRDMHEMSIFVCKCIVEMLGEAGHKVKILYGGSVDETNALRMLKDGNIAGFLVGRASEDGVKLATLLETIKEAA